MTETKANYGPKPLYRTTISYHLYYQGETITSEGVIGVEAKDAVEAGHKALAAMEQFTPPWGTVFNLQLSVALVVPDQGRKE